MQKELEKDIQSAILQLLRLKGYFVWKQNSAGIMKTDGHYIPSQMPGIADIIGVDPKGRFVGIEVKRPGGKMSDLQRGFQESVKRNHGLAAVVYSVDDMIAKLSEWAKL